MIDVKEYTRLPEGSIYECASKGTSLAGNTIVEAELVYRDSSVCLDEGSKFKETPERANAQPGRQRRHTAVRADNSTMGS
jgi:hypothetical protein